MLQTIRDRASGWFAYIIIGMLIIPFALWGINSYFGNEGLQDVAQVGDGTISQREFQQAYQQQRQRMQSMLGADYNPTPADETRLKTQVLQQLVNERVLLQAAKQQGLRVGDLQLRQAIVTTGAFQKDGVFDSELYKRLLRYQGYTEPAFEEGLRRSLAAEQLQEGIMASAIVTPTALDKVIGLLNQKREIHYLVLPFAKYLAAATVDDSAVDTYFQANKNRFMEPEQVKLQYLELKLEQMAEGIPVSPEEVQKAYEEQIASYRQPEERSASHILFKVAQDASPEAIDKARLQAQEIHQAIVAGTKTFQQALEEAKAAGTEGVEASELGVIRQGMLDPAFESTLYALKAVGDVSEPVKSPFGFHIIHLDAITPERIKNLTEVQDELSRQLRLKKAENLFYEAAQQLTELSYEHPDSLAPAADKLGVKIAESPWFTRKGGEGIAAYPKVVETAFSENVLKRGQNSGPLEVQPNHIIVIRLQEHKEATPQSLEQVRDEIVKELRNRQAREALGKEIEALRNQAKQGKNLQALATESGGELKNAGLVERTDKAVDPAILREAFQLAPPVAGKVSIGSAALGTGDQAVIAVSQVAPGDTKSYPETDRKSLEQRLSQQMGVNQFEGLLDSLRKRADVVTYSDKL